MDEKILRLLQSRSFEDILLAANLLNTRSREEIVKYFKKYGKESNIYSSDLCSHVITIDREMDYNWKVIQSGEKIGFAISNAVIYVFKPEGWEQRDRNLWADKTFWI